MTINNYFRFAWFGVLILAAGGYSSLAVDLKVTRLKTNSLPASSPEVKIFKLEDKIDRPYEVLGVVSVLGNRLSARSGNTKKQMQAAAAAMGADALAAYYYDDEINTSTEAWAGALAVKFMEAGSKAEVVPVAGIVVVPHFAAAEELAKNKKARRTEEAARKWARFILARKGYYAFLTEDLYPGVNGLSLMDLPQDKLRQFGRSEADRILELRFLSKTGISIGLLNSEANNVMALLHSKTGGTAATWTGSGIGASAIGGIADVFVPSAKTIESMRWALEETFKKLPDISTAGAAK